MTDQACDATALDFLCPEEMADPSVTIQRLYAGDRCRLYEKFRPLLRRLTLRGCESRAHEPDAVPERSRPGTELRAGQRHCLRCAHAHLLPPSGAGRFQAGRDRQTASRLEAIADELLDAVEDQETWDLHDDFAFPLPVTIICEIFGVPTDDLRQFKEWSDTSVAALSAQDPSAYAEELTRMRDYLIALLHERHDDLGDQGLLARIARARRDGEELSDAEAVSLVLQLFVAGNETTTSLITNVMMRLLGDGYQWADFCAGKIDTKNLINESLRYDPPLLAMFRTTADDETIAGTRIPAGTKVMIHYAAANRDPEMFENPDAFDVQRPIRKIMSFALGIHFCIGAELAKLEAEVMLEALRKRCPNLKMIDEGERIGPFLFWGRRKLPVKAARRR